MNRTKKKGRTTCQKTNAWKRKASIWTILFLHELRSDVYSWLGVKHQFLTTYSPVSELLSAMDHRPGRGGGLISPCAESHRRQPPRGLEWGGGDNRRVLTTEKTARISASSEPSLLHPHHKTSSFPGNWLRFCGRRLALIWISFVLCDKWLNSQAFRG